MTSIEHSVRPERALAVGAHPDDVEFGCGATIAKWAAAGTVVDLVVLTDGSKGTWDARADLVALIARRAQEQRDAATVLGVRDVHLLGRVDGELAQDLAIRAQLCALIRTLRPDIVLGHDPWHDGRLHPDHHVAGAITIESIVAARDPHFFADQGLAPHRPRAAMLFEPGRVTHVEDVDGFVATKVEALLAHRSQWRSTMRIADEHDESQRARFAERVHSVARLAGLRIGARAGETFRVIDRV
ncbi:MAG TPA: PIG-L deacetylase family protein [Acidimicrobiia bacterium]|nr:PIG-L deacetylase family protein [Acidimicrobiia bacterium]